MKRVLSPLPDTVRGCLRVPVGTPTAETELPPASSPHAARERHRSSSGAAALPVMLPPYSPSMSRGLRRAPLSTVQQVSGVFLSPGAKRLCVAERVVTGATSPDSEISPSREALPDLAGGALRVVTTPGKVTARYRASYGGDRRKSAGGSGDNSHVPRASRPKDQASTTGFAAQGAVAQATSRMVEDCRRCSGGEHTRLASRAGAAALGDVSSRSTKGRDDNATSIVSGGSLGPPLRELRRVSIAHCNGSVGGRRGRGVGEMQRRKSTQDASSSGEDVKIDDKQRSSESTGAAKEGASRRVSTWSTCSSASTNSRRSSGEGSCDGAGNKGTSSTAGLPSTTGGLTNDQMARCDGSTQGVTTKRGREEIECEECERLRKQPGQGGDEHENSHDIVCKTCDAKAQASGCADASRDDAGVHPGSKKPRRSIIVVPSQRRSSVSTGSTAAIPSTKSVGFADGAQGADCDWGQHLSIDHFEVNKSLGMGKFGRVYRAKVKQSTKSKTVALKLLSKSTLNDARRQERVNLKREVEIQTKLSHSNIVRMMTWFQDPKWFYLVLDYAAGGDVYKALCRNGSGSGLPHAVAARYLRDAVSAVAYLHENHVVHRDIKPENLLLDSRGRVKLSDFGWSVHAVPPRFHERQTLCGTPEYAAPEMLVLGPKYTYPVDIWSLGVLAYELLAGKTPFVSARPTRTAVSSSSPGGTGAKKSVAAEIETVHEGDPHAQLYGRIVEWNGSPRGLFGGGTLGESIPDVAQDVVLAMLRPRAEDRLETREVLLLPWLASADHGES